MKQMNYKKLIIPNIPYVFFVYLFDKVGQAARLAPGESGLLALDWLNGNRSVLTDASLSGLLVGATLRRQAVRACGSTADRQPNAEQSRVTPNSGAVSLTPARRSECTAPSTSESS